jgi:HEAT repeat protein
LVCALWLLTFALAEVAALGQTPAPTTAQRCRDLLDQALKARNPDTRKEAVVALSIGGAREPFLTLLSSMLSDKDWAVRLATVTSLADLKSNSAVDSLRRALNDRTPEVSFAAAKALLELDDPVGKNALLSVLSGQTKTSASYFTKQTRDALRMMHTPKPMFILALKTGIGFAPVPGLGEGMSSMQGLLADSGVSGRAMAALLLAKEQDAETAAALREALTDKQWSVRAAAIHSLALRDDPSMEAIFAPLLDDSKEPVRLSAAAAYLRLDIIKRQPTSAPNRAIAPSGGAATTASSFK